MERYNRGPVLDRLQTSHSHQILPRLAGVFGPRSLLLLLLLRGIALHQRVMPHSKTQESCDTTEGCIATLPEIYKLVGVPELVANEGEFLPATLET